MVILRGAIYMVELGPTRGKEIDNKRRPVLVLSIDVINRAPLVITVVPGTTKNPSKPVRRNEVVVTPTDTNGLTNPTAFLCFQLKALDHSRFENPPIGVITVNDLGRIEDTVRLCLGLL